jgi:hypothetical protein
VDREHQIAGGQQRLHPRPAVGFDAQPHLVRLGRRIQMIRDQLVQHVMMMPQANGWSLAVAAGCLRT